MALHRIPYSLLILEETVTPRIKRRVPVLVNEGSESAGRRLWSALSRWARKDA
jgi:hypothetical protein